MRRAVAGGALVLALASPAGAQALLASVNHLLSRDDAVIGGAILGLTFMGGAGASCSPNCDKEVPAAAAGGVAIGAAIGAGLDCGVEGHAVGAGEAGVTGCRTFLPETCGASCARRGGITALEDCSSACRSAPWSARAPAIAWRR